MSSDNVVLGLDIGSSRISVSVCELNASGEINLKGVGNSVSTGLIRGKIVDKNELFRSIDRAIKRAERTAGVKPTRVVSNVPLFGLNLKHNPGFVLSKSDTGQIIEAEKSECIRRSKNISKNSDETLLHAIPLEYTVDGEKALDPIGVFGRNLEVNTHLILGHSETIMALTEILKDLNLNISGFVYDPLGLSLVTLTQEERQKGVVLIDIGGRFTKISYFKNQLLQFSSLIPIGGETITSDIATCLDVTIPEAERLKIVQSDPILSRIDDKKLIEVRKKGNEKVEIKKMYLSQIVEARLAELTKYIQKIFDTMPKKIDESTPIVLAGGTRLLRGLPEFFNLQFPNPIRSGLPENMKAILETPESSTSVGVVLYAIRTHALKFSNSTKHSVLTRVKKWFREF